MLYLLEFRRDEDVSLLPVAERTAARLERALLTEDATTRRVILAQALKTDPALALWTADQSNQCGENLLVSCDEAAKWLSDCPAEKLSRAIPGNCLTVLSGDARRYAHLCANILDQSRRAAAGVEELRDGQRDQTNWRSLVEQGQRLIDHCPHDSHSGTRLLPSFRPVAPPGPRLDQSIDDLPNDGSLVEFFLAEVPGVVWRLPALIRRLATLEVSIGSFDRRLEQEKLASLKELAYGASHEINNPLANISARSQTLLRDETDPERRRKLTSIRDQAMRAHEMIADLMLFAQPPPMVPELCKLGQLVMQIVEELADRALQRSVALIVRIDRDEVMVHGDATQLAVAIRGVIVNALEAVGDEGRVEVLVNAVGPGHQLARIVVSDDGPGISEEIRPHIFDPFFSGREAGRGLGFGLSKCWRIVNDHRGQLDVQRAQLGGAEITILLPVESTAVRVA